MRIIGSSYPIGLSVMGLLLIGLTGDTGVHQPRNLAYYLGAQTAETDPGFERFVQALGTHRVPLPKNFELRYLSGPLNDARALEGLIMGAAANRPLLLIAPTFRMAAVAHRLVPQTPLVFATYPDPLASGLVASVSNRAVPITGLSLFDALDAKRLEILQLGFPSMRKLAVLADGSWIKDRGKLVAILGKQRFGVPTTIFQADSPADVVALLDAPQSRDYDAWYIPPSFIAQRARDEIIFGLRNLGKPAIHSTSDEVNRGALMAYEQDVSFRHQALADLVARVLAGEDARHIPIERPRRYVLAVRADADALRMGMSPAMVRQADLVYTEAVANSPNK
jgi:putative ABC transport system substrate-binding protein